MEYRSTMKHVRFSVIFSLLLFFLFPKGVTANVSQVHLSWQNDPSTTMTIVWSTEKAKADIQPIVQYGKTSAYGSTASGSNANHGVIVHTVEIAGLQPDTRYYYRLSDHGGKWSGGMSFRTAPAAGQTAKGGIVVTVSGDKGPYSDAQAINQQITAQNAHLHLIVGDLAYTSKDDRYHEWLDQQQSYAQSAPLMPVWGNHDTTDNDPPYNVGQAHFALPKNATADERYYAYTVGNAHFIAVDSNTDSGTAPGTAQYKWLQNDLSAAAANPRINWIIVYFHHNIYSGEGKYSDTATPVRAHFQPFFDQFGVDLVLNGHNHYYARSMPVGYNAVVKRTDNNSNQPELYDFTPKDHGQIYVTTGGGGKPLYSCPSLPAFMIRCDAAYSFGRFTIDSSRLTFTALRSDGTVLDDGFTITKSILPPPSPITMAPLQPTGRGTKPRVESQFNPMDDAMAHEANPSKNYGHAPYVKVDRREQGGEMEAYFRFNITGIFGPIKKAIFQITTADIPFADSDSTGLPYLLSDTTWNEDTVNWITRPAYNPSPVPNNKITTIGKSKTATFDLTNAISKNGQYSFALRSDSTDGVVYVAKESNEKKPVLIITWEKE